MIFGDIGILERPLERISKMIRNSKFWTELVSTCGLYKNEQLKYGEPQLLDDCIDVGFLLRFRTTDLDTCSQHWTSHHHLVERQMLFAKFGEIAANNLTRVSWLTGDVHCAGFGRLRTIGTTTETELYDPMTMYQVISSAIANAPPPVFVRWLFERTDGPPWGVFRKVKPPAPQPGRVEPRRVEETSRREAEVQHGGKRMVRADTYYEKMRAKYASQFVGRTIKSDPGTGQMILGKVEEGLVRGSWRRRVD